MKLALNFISIFFIINCFGQTISLEETTGNFPNNNNNYGEIRTNQSNGFMFNNNITTNGSNISGNGASLNLLKVVTKIRMIASSIQTQIPQNLIF